MIVPCLSKFLYIPCYVLVIVSVLSDVYRIIIKLCIIAIKLCVYILHV